jgi:hypothetical protein
LIHRNFSRRRHAAAANERLLWIEWEGGYAIKKLLIVVTIVAAGVTTPALAVSTWATATMIAPVEHLRTISGANLDA